MDYSDVDYYHSPPLSLKRRAASPLADVSPPKRRHSTLGLDSSMQLIRRTASGQAVPLEQGIASTDEQGDEGEDSIAALPEQPEQEEYVDDLFTHAFGDAAHAAGDGDENGDDDDDDDDEQDKNDNDQIIHAAAKIAPSSTAKQSEDSHPFVESEHVQGCTHSRSSSTPPPPPAAVESPTNNIKREPSPAPSSLRDSTANPIHTHSSSSSTTATPPPSDPKAINPDRDLSLNLIRHKRLHIRAYQLIPRLELPAGRYWIGVLKLANTQQQQHAAAAAATKAPARSSKAGEKEKEKDFTWMKGHRLTTVSTVWHAYQTAHFIDEDFVLLLGGHERVAATERMEELDYFNDRLVCFRAVKKAAGGAADAGGESWEVSAGAVPREPPVEIDLTGED